MSKSGTADNPTRRRFRKWNRPPEGEQWMWRTRSMLESPAWRAMPPYAKQVLERVEIEHMHHGGTANGELPVTYDDFEIYGVRRKSIPLGISIACKLGWLDLVTRGVRGYGTARRPHKFGLTWLPRADFTPASNRWKGITEAEAIAVLNLFPQGRNRTGPGAKTPHCSRNNGPNSPIVTENPRGDNATTIYILPGGRECAPTVPYSVTNASETIVGTNWPDAVTLARWRAPDAESWRIDDEQAALLERALRRQPASVAAAP